VLDGLGRPIDGRGPLPGGETAPINNAAPHPLRRRPIAEPLVTGVRAIDGLLTCGKGQRLGIFAGSGVGKSTLMGTIARSSRADVSVIALVGERGREVQEFIDRDLGKLGLARSVVVVSTSDQPALVRLKAAWVATTIAEYFRDTGRSVLLLIDSVTRFARAQREIGLAIGEPPTRRGFPPSLFAALPRLMERSGPGQGGSITGIYTVLVEGDGTLDPVAEETTSILDGHIILSRELAQKNHYPAIDVLRSRSRLMDAIVQVDHRKSAGRLRELLSRYKEVELLLRVGEYERGSDPLADEAIAKIDRINAFLRQSQGETTRLDDVRQQLMDLCRNESW
jgi:type III secretion protein N (ATPase)